MYMYYEQVSSNHINLQPTEKAKKSDVDEMAELMLDMEIQAMLDSQVILDMEIQSLMDSQTILDLEIRLMNLEGGI